jgi:hypothetical protein
LVDREARAHERNSGRESPLGGHIAWHQQRTGLEILRDATADHLSGISERYRVEAGDGGDRNGLQIGGGDCRADRDEMCDGQECHRPG